MENGKTYLLSNKTNLKTVEYNINRKRAGKAKKAVAYMNREKGKKKKIKLTYFVEEEMQYLKFGREVDTTSRNLEAHTTNQATSIRVTGRKNAVFLSISWTLPE